MGRALTSLAIAKNLVEELESLRPTEKELVVARALIRKKRRQRRRKTKGKAPEYIAEALLRPVITERARELLELATSDCHHRIYSSHFHTVVDDEKVWRQRKNAFFRAHPDADTWESRQRRRADLFIARAANRIISIEFKYVGPGRIPRVDLCVRQIRQFLTRHEACLLVIYAAKKASDKLPMACQRILDQLRDHRAFVVTISGPPIIFPK